jgi:hypothetical protein
LDGCREQPVRQLGKGPGDGYFVGDLGDVVIGRMGAKAHRDHLFAPPPQLSLAEACPKPNKRGRSVVTPGRPTALTSSESPQTVMEPRGLAAEKASFLFCEFVVGEDS